MHWAMHACAQDTTGVELIQGRSGGPARPMMMVKKEKVERAANFKRVMHEVTMLGSFVRLADYLFVEGEGGTQPQGHCSSGVVHMQFFALQHPRNVWLQCVVRKMGRQVRLPRTPPVDISAIQVACCGGSLASQASLTAP